MLRYHGPLQVLRSTQNPFWTFWSVQHHDGNLRKSRYLSCTRTVGGTLPEDIGQLGHSTCLQLFKGTLKHICHSFQIWAWTKLENNAIMAAGGQTLSVLTPVPGHSPQNIHTFAAAQSRAEYIIYLSHLSTAKALIVSQMFSFQKWE